MSELILESPIHRDLSWMKDLCDIDSEDWRNWQPTPCLMPWIRFDGVKERAPAVAVWCGAQALIMLGEYKGILFWEDKDIRQCLLDEAQLMWPLPDPPCEMIRGVDFEQFKRWVDDHERCVLGRIGELIVERSELSKLLARVPAEPLTLAWPQGWKRTMAVHILGETFKIFHQPVERRLLRIPFESIPEFTKG